MQQIRQRRDVRSLWPGSHIGQPPGAMRLRSLRRVRLAPASARMKCDRRRVHAALADCGPSPERRTTPRRCRCPFWARPAPVRSRLSSHKDAAGRPRLIAGPCARAPLVPPAAGCWARDGCRQGLERHDRLHCLLKATLCSSKRRYAVSGTKGTPVTVRGRLAWPAHCAPRKLAACPRILARGCSRFPGRAAK
jgi:hypothetical protein